MAATSRTALFGKIQKALKKQSCQAVVPDPNRPVLEHLLFAACLENAQYSAAEEAYAALEHGFFGWNEIRVSTVRELAEVMTGLPDPARSASNFKRLLHSVFELRYAFDLEDLRKMNLGPAVELLRKLDGSNNFSVSYVIQAALGGHAIPVDESVLELFRVLGLASEEDIKKQEAPGLDRAIAKSKGVEFGSLLHQFSVDFMANPFSPDMHRILLQINPDAADNLPRRQRAKKTKEADTKSTKKSTKKSAAKRQTKSDEGSKKATPKKAPSKSEKSEAKQSVAATGKRKTAAEKPVDTKRKKATAKSPAKKKAGASRLSKKKPR